MAGQIDAAIRTEERDGTTVLIVSGRLDVQAIGRLWKETLRTARQAKAISLDLTGLDYCDMSGAALLIATETAHGKPVALTGASAQTEALLQRARLAAAPSPAAPAAGPTEGPSLFAGVADNIAYLGEVAVAVATLPKRARMLRVPDLMRYADQAGVKAIPLVLLLGFLMGLILAFQSAVPMRRFGADLYVANLVAISLLRELGPLLSAVILAGRTGSAFAAEIGSMKVNQEIDALVTMSLDPVTMLVLPRLIAAMLVMPAMVLALDVAGLLGMATVMKAFGYPLVTVAHQVQAAANATDLFGGLFKGLCFGFAVAVIGCRAGLGTGVGPRAVGQAATAAVVGGIVATIFLDGLFALLFYRLGL
jgi:phospholipid/cholesterol/gamma-HCH transport system permease protein